MGTKCTLNGIFYKILQAMVFRGLREMTVSTTLQVCSIALLRMMCVGMGTGMAIRFYYSFTAFYILVTLQQRGRELGN